MRTSHFFGGSLSSLAFSRSVLALVMIGAGILHFVATDAYVSIMPDYPPLHRELVYLSGFSSLSLSTGNGGFPAGESNLRKRPERRLFVSSDPRF